MARVMQYQGTFEPNFSQGGAAMACRRCRGLAVVDHFIDMQDGGHLWLRAWRCVNCGDVVEPGIIRNRLTGNSLLARLVHRVGRTHRKQEPIPIGI
jgi:hypothetical protein